LSSYEKVKEFTPVIIRKILHDLYIDPSEAIIGLGLPVVHYSNKEAFKTSVKKGIPELSSVYMFPQGLGVIADLGTKSQNIMIFDIGFNTTDIIVVHSGAVVSGECTSLPATGFGTVIDDLATHINDVLQTDLQHSELLDVFRKKSLFLDGKDNDLSAVVDALTHKHIAVLIEKLKKKYTERLRRTNLIVLAGGGARIITKLDDPLFDGRITIPKNPEFSNARGFYLKALQAYEKATAGKVVA
jgi:hypothetical protein